MGWVHIQMIDNSVSSDWWKKIISHFIKAREKLEIRCWKEETAEIQQASLYGEPMENEYEVSIISNAIEPYGDSFSVDIGE